MTSTSANELLVDPDDECTVCGMRREEHGDAHHYFSLDGELRPIKQGDKPRQQPPQERTTQENPMHPTAKVLAESLEAKLMLRVIERLTMKSFLNGADLQYIFGGDDVATGRRSTGG